VPAQAAHQVEGLPLGTFPGQGQGVRRHALLDRVPDLRRGPEEAVRGHRAPDALVWTPEVVGLHEKPDPPLTVLEIREDGAGQKLLPQRLPEALDLPQGLRVVRPALDVPDALAMKLGLEVGVPAPRHVLPALVGQDLTRRAVLCDPTRQRLQDQRSLLVVRHQQRDQIARVVVHESGDVQPVMATEQEREDVRLPELVRLRALEPVLGRTRFGDRLRYRLQ
jgi:hypothetical protein